MDRAVRAARSFRAYRDGDTSGMSALVDDGAAQLEVSVYNEVWEVHRDQVVKG